MDFLLLYLKSRENPDRGVIYVALPWQWVWFWLYFIFHPVRRSSCSMQSFNKKTVSDRDLFRISQAPFPMENTLIFSQFEQKKSQTKNLS